VFFSLLPGVVSAHPGGTDSSGCHTCRTNCASWGLSYGEYHCHQSKGYSQPESPIRSHYGDSGTGWTESWPDYSYSAPSIPSCPIFSSYDSLSGGCKCYSGYAAKNGSCVSLDSICQDDLGYSSSYNSLNNSCECSYGYVIDGGRCISSTSYCWNKYGYHSSYDSIGKSCECDNGYEYDSSTNQCISHTDSCTNQFGYNAEYDSLSEGCRCKSGYITSASKNSCISENSYCQNQLGYNSSFDSFSKSCECSSGYTLENGSCVEEEEDDYVPYYNFPTPVSYPVPTTQNEPVKTTPIKTNPVAPTKTDSVTQKTEGNTFSLLGNERLRSCPGFGCLSKGTFIGTAKVLETEGDWYKVLVDTGTNKIEGWFNELLVPSVIKDSFKTSSTTAVSIEKDGDKEGFFVKLLNFFGIRK
jgi:hypothetical protein